MAVAQMTKVMIASHQSEAAELLRTLQRDGIIEILNAERAMVSKEWPELQTDITRPRDLEELAVRLSVGIDFLKQYATKKDETNLFNPLLSIDSAKYASVVESNDAIELLEQAEAVASKIEKCNADVENAHSLLAKLRPWQSMDGELEQLQDLEQASCMIGLIPNQHIEAITEELKEAEAGIEIVGSTATMKACIIACLNEKVAEVQKKLRSVDFEAVSFEGLDGTIKDNIALAEESIKDSKTSLEQLKAEAVKLADNKIQLQVLFDHYQNLIEREVTRNGAPGTENVDIFEGWVKEKDYSKLERIVSKFGASSMSKMELAEDEEPPVEIDNGKFVKPFEFITRLYGMPSPRDIDPTAALAPFFAMFFGICLTDAGYGLIMAAVLWWALKKTKGDKGVLWMFMACSISTVIAGALTGGWFGDAVVKLIGEGTWLDNIRVKLMLFDPMKQPLIFFGLSLALGFIQIMFGLCLALYNNIKHKDYGAAIFEQVTWIVLLNSLALLGMSKGGVLPSFIGNICGVLAILMAILIFFFTERKSGMAGRIGGGVFALFNTVFYFGDILSYVRLMALGMVTAGLGMAVNILVDLLMDIPYGIGYVLGAVLFVGGHLFNLAMSMLSSFVHSLRLQFVEFFPKFLTGTGKSFEPLKSKYQYISIDTDSEKQ